MTLFSFIFIAFAFELSLFVRLAACSVDTLPLFQPPMASLVNHIKASLSSNFDSVSVETQLIQKMSDLTKFGFAASALRDTCSLVEVLDLDLFFSLFSYCVINFKFNINKNRRVELKIC